MTLVATPSIKEKLNNNSFNLFKAPGKPTAVIALKSNTVIDRLNKNEIIYIKSFTAAPADGLFLHARYAITFSLKDKFATHFVLLRGLLEFSRPKTIKIMPNTISKNFYIELSENQVEHFVTYLETIVAWLMKEIKFKEALRALITFEKEVKHKQATLYANLRASA